MRGIAWHGRWWLCTLTLYHLPWMRTSSPYSLWSSGTAAVVRLRTVCDDSTFGAIVVLSVILSAVICNASFMDRGVKQEGTMGGQCGVHPKDCMLLLAVAHGV